MNETPPPPWLHPDFRLVTGQGEWTWRDLPVPGGECPLLASGDDLPGLAAALVAGWQRQVPVALLRGGLPPPADAPTNGRQLILETSGTTGTPKRLVRSFAEIVQGITPPMGRHGGRWLLTYDACGFAGLQVMLTAMAGGGTLLTDPAADAGTLVRLAATAEATHISATPSFWRVLLLTGAAPPLAQITIGGEAVDQPLLDALSSRFPGVPIRCIYATTELGRLFTVRDGRAGFPALWLTQPPGAISFRINNDMLQVGRNGLWHDTGDLVEVIGDRFLFRGRNDLTLNVGGTKVNPILAEERLLALPGVTDAVVYGIPNPITGTILAADIVAAAWAENPDWRAVVTQAVGDLPPAARPRRLRLLDALPLSAAGKKRRIVEEA